MKKAALILSYVLLAFASETLFSQPAGFVASDRFGNKYDIDDLNVLSANPLGRLSVLAPTNSCAAGYFEAYYVPGCLLDVNNSAQAVLCQVLKDISALIGSALSPSLGVRPKIRLVCADTPSSLPTALGMASGFYVYPGNPSNPNQGIFDDELEGTNIYNFMQVEEELYYGDYSGARSINDGIEVEEDNEVETN